MRSYIILALAASTLAGCGAGNGEVWALTIPYMDNYDCETNYTENFIEANPPEDTSGSSDWVYQNEMAFSDGVVFAQIVDGKKNEVFLVVNDVIYPGTKSSDGYTFTWMGTEVVTDGEQFIPDPYAFEIEVSNASTTTIKLGADRDTGGLSGTWEVETSINETYAETDVWGPEVPYYTGQINPYSSVYLVGTGSLNDAEREDCESEPCSLSIEAACAGSVNIQAAFVGYADEGVFDAIEDAEQPIGTAGGL